MIHKNINKLLVLVFCALFVNSVPFSYNVFKREITYNKAFAQNVQNEHENDEENIQEINENNDEIIIAQPDEETIENWSDPPDDEYELLAQMVDDDNYLENCAIKSECQATIDYVDSALKDLLSNYKKHSKFHRNGHIHSKALSLNQAARRYRVLLGQKLQLLSKRAGANDNMIWFEIVQIIPQEQSDRLLNSFMIINKKSDDTLAYVENEEDSSKFLMAVNEPMHLGTDKLERDLTIVHEFMHMLVLEQAKNIDYSDNSKPVCNGTIDEDFCFKNNSIYHSFITNFWTKSDLANYNNSNFYEKNQNRFVTEYAASSPHEDISESFAYWVISDTISKDIIGDKQSFFGKYSNLVALKAHIRRAIIADILRKRKKVN